MKRKIIAIDVDDVIADSNESMRLRVNERAGANLTREHYLTEGDYWGYYERVWEAHGLKDKVTYADHAAEMAKDQSHVPLLPGASFAMGELAKRFDIVVVTARDYAWEKETLRWLNNHFGNIFRGVHFAGNKHVEGAKSKGQQARELGAAWLIDDNPEHCQSALDEGLEVILFGEYGWHYDAPPHMTRCRDWPAVLEYFDGQK